MGENGKRLGVGGVIGLVSAMVLAGCGNEQKDPVPTADATLKPTELYDHRVAVERGENLIVCFTDEEPLSDGVDWAFVADQAYCPDTKANLIFLGEEGPVISPFRLDIKRQQDFFEHTDQEAIRNKGQEIPPPFMGV